MSIADSENAQNTSVDPNPNLSTLLSNLEMVNDQLLAANTYLDTVRSCVDCATAEDILSSPYGTLVWACWHSVKTVMLSLTTGLVDIPITQHKKLLSALHAHERYLERQLALISMLSTPLYAKPARIGKKSKAQSRLASSGRSNRKPSRPKNG